MELKKAFYSPTEVADLFGMKTSDSVMNWIHEGKVAAIQLSARTYRIPQRAVARLLDEPVAESRMIEEPSGGPAVGKRIRERIRAEERTPAAR